MGFASGSVSYRRFAVEGEAPKALDQAVLDQLAEYSLKTSEFSVPDEIEYGWSGGRHVLDGNFSFENNVFNDCLSFALRIDTNKVPSDLKKAYQMIEEEAAAAGNPSGFISKEQKRQVKDSIRMKMDEELRSGRFRKSKLIPLLWDLARGELYTPASGTSLEKLHEIFERSFGLTLIPGSSGSAALRWAEKSGRKRDYEDTQPTRFAYGPEGESQRADYPWILKGPEPKDFLGNELGVWLWHELDTTDGTLDTPAGHISLVLDKTLDLDCVYAMTGRDSLKADGPTHMPEARDALRTGKVPRRMGMILHAGYQFELKLHLEDLSLNGVKLPEVEEADSPRVLFEERINMLRDLNDAMDGLLANFLKVRLNSTWEGQVTSIRRWIAASSKQVAHVA